MVIYKTTNLVNGKFYIGKDSKNDPSYLGSGDKLKNAIKKYGRENFKKKILEECTSKTIDQREIYWIKETKALSRGYNIAIGGQGGDLGKTVNLKRSKSLTGKTQSENTKQKRSDSLKGRKITWGDKISTAMKGKTWKQKSSRTVEHREKLSKANKGHIKSKETLEKMSTAKKGKSPGNKGKFLYQGKYFTYEEYIKVCKDPKKPLDLLEIQKLRDRGMLWKDVANIYGYNRETIRIWYNKKKSV